MSKWPIRRKLLFGLSLLLVLVATMAASGFRGVYAYRSIVRSLSGRSSELPLAAALNSDVSDLRTTMGEIRGSHESTPDAVSHQQALATTFRAQIAKVERALSSYRSQLTSADRVDERISDSSREWQTVGKIEACLQSLKHTTSNTAWSTDAATITKVSVGTTELHELAGELPSFLHEQFHDLAHEVRTQYRTLIILEWITTIAGGILLLVLVKLSYDWVIQPLRLIIRGSRRVAAGDFEYRIHMTSHDEMRELADAMNAMTARFQATRDDLDRQVAERTKQVIRSEQLASVGFLAAGVAHEINNPLASIAMCAESLESRIDDVLSDGTPTDPAQHAVIRKYLQMIQTEAFRCKGITGKLLDFSRRGDVDRQHTDLRELVSGVIEMVGHLGKYHDTRIEFEPGPPMIAPVNPQQLKQVVLNLITNGLESLSPGGVVCVTISKRDGHAEISFVDSGCGMTSEVLEHLFEPFFTRRRAGQGIGLGLSITYRIVADHQGHIDVSSDGPGHGSRFCVRLPLEPKQVTKLSKAA